MVPDAPVSTEETARAVLVARDVMTAVGFKNREAELQRIGHLVDEGRGVIWVTGAARSGKSCLASRFVRDRGWQAKAARFELRGGADVQAVLEGVNRFLRDRNEHRFDSWCRTANVATADRAAALCNVLKGGGYVIVLDSFEDVAEDPGWTEFVAVMQEGLEGSRVFVGSRRMPDWGDRHCQVEVGPIEEAAGKQLLVEAGAPESALDELFQAVGGLPGALESAGALARKRTAREVLDDIGKSSGDVAEGLLAETYEAASDDAQHLWMGLCVLPGGVTRDAAGAMCEGLAFDDAWDELVEWHMLEPGAERAELHALARAVGDRRLEGMAQWRRACGQRIAKFYAQFAKARADDRAAIEAELENILAAARLAFQYREWEALWDTGFALWGAMALTGYIAEWRDLMRMCYESARATGNDEMQQKWAHNYAVALRWMGRLTEAEELCKESIGIAIRRGDAAGQAMTLHEQGVLADMGGDPARGRELLLRSLQAAIETGEPQGRLMATHDLGVVAEHLEDWPEAERRYLQEIEIIRNEGLRHQERMAVYQLSGLALRRGEVGKARKLALQAGQLSVASSDRAGEARTWHRLGTIEMKAKNWTEAEKHLERAYAREIELGMLPEAAGSLWAWGVVSQSQGDLALAESRLAKAAAMMEEMGLAQAEQAKADLDRLRKRLEEDGAGE